MSEATAVLDPEVETETQAAPETETQAPVNPEGTDGSPAVQPETPSETPPAESEPERLRREAHEADIAVAREEAREEARQELQQSRQTERQKQNLAAFHQGFGTTAAQVRQTAARLTIQDAAGALRNLTPQEINSLFIAPFEAHNGFVLGTKEDDLNSPTAEAVEALLSKDAYKGFAEKANGKSARDYLSEFAEARALDTKAVKGMTLEEAEGSSAKVRSAVTKLRADLAEAVEKAKTLTDKYGPEGDPLKNGNTRGSSPRSDEEMLLDPTTPIEEVRKILDRING